MPPDRERSRRCSTGPLLSALVAGLLAAACGDAGTPVSPSAVVATPPAPTPSPGAGNPVPGEATLVVSSFQMRFVAFAQEFYWYRPAIALRETTGAGTAMLESLLVELPDGDTTEIGAGCFYRDGSMVVRAGGSWSSDAIYPYCLDVESRLDLSGRLLSLTVRYRDERGAPKRVMATTTVPPHAP